MSVPTFGSFQPQRKADPGPKQPKDLQRKRRRVTKSEYAASRDEVTIQIAPELRDNASPSRPLATVDKTGPWVTDLRGDSLNLQYGSLHSRTIPRYRFMGSGRVLGLRPELQKVVVDNKLQISFGRFRRSSRKASTRYAKSLPAPGKRAWRHDSSRSTEHEALTEFNPVSKPHAVREPVDPEYRQLDPEVSDDSHSGVEDDQSYLLPAEQIRNQILEEKLRTHPTCIFAWRSLIDHALRSSGEATPSVRATIAVTILQRALQATSVNITSAPLWAAYLFWGEALWESSKLEKEWERALNHVVDEQIWLEWLSWRVRSSRQGVLGVLTVDGPRCLANVRDESLKLTALWWIIVTLQDAGYTELGNALIQAECELALFKPYELERRSFSEQLDSLEKFWEKELPLIGERLAVGWKNSENPPDRLDRDAPKPSGISPSRKTQGSDPFTRWMLDERISERRQSMRSSKTDVEDVYSMVLFADIKNLLIRLEKPQSKKVLKRIWLSLLGLHIPGFFQHLNLQVARIFTSDQGFWSRTQIRRYSFLQDLYIPKAVKSESRANTAFASDINLELGPVKEWGCATMDSLEGINAGGHYRMWEAMDVETTDVPTARILFEQLKDPTDPEWDDLELVFEAAVDLPRAIQISRERVKVNQNSFRLWHLHAKLEILSRRFTTAQKIYENVLTTGDSHPEKRLLWAAYARMVWLTGKTEKVVGLICRACGLQQQDSYSSLDILRTKIALDEALVDNNVRSVEDVRAVVRLRFLLELVVGGVEALLSIFDFHLKTIQTLEELLPGARECGITELFLLLHHHILQLRRPFSRAELRRRVCDALELYPNNTFYLALFLECERGESLWGRTWELISEERRIGLHDQFARVMINRRLWDIWAATHRFGSHVLLNDAPRLRRLFSKWVENTGLRGNSLFWRLWIELEIRVHALKRAKALLFRAISHCIPDKDLLLLPFGPLRSEFRGQELLGLIDLMAERGIRLRKDIEPYLANWVGDGPEQTEINDEPLDEIEQKAAEYRKLLPYR